MYQLLVLALLAVTCLGLAAHLASVFLVWLWVRWHRRTAARQTSAARPGVSVIKPLRGLDEELEQNLVSFFELDYGPLQLIFACEDAHDPALRLVRRIAQRYPRRDVTILGGLSGPAASPKVMVQEAALPRAKHELVLLSDSNVRIGRDDLTACVDAMLTDPRIGMLYQPIVGRGERTFAAAVENLRWSEATGAIALAAWLLFRAVAVTGKGLLCRREALRDIGDLEVARDAAGDDQVSALAMLRAGWRVVPAPVPAQVVHTDWGWSKFVNRHGRHAAIRATIVPAAFAFEWILYPILPALAALALWPSGVTCALLALTVVVKGASDVANLRLLRGTRLAPRFWLAPLARDLVSVPMWLSGLFLRRVNWRGRWYRMGAMSMMTPVEAVPQPAAAETAPSAAFRRANAPLVGGAGPLVESEMARG